MPSPYNITSIPAPRVDFIDPRTGLMAREWYRFFFNLFNLTGAGTTDTSLADLQVGPPDVSSIVGQLGITYDQAQIAAMMAQYDQANKDTQSWIDSFPDQEQFAELFKRVEDLEKRPSSIEWAETLKRIDALEYAPVPQTHLKKAAYGSFYDTTTQTAAAINTAYAMTFNTTDITNGVYIGSPTSRIYVDTTSLYNIQFSAQLDNTSGGNHLAYIWLRINGTDVLNSASQVRLKGTDGELVASWNFVQLLKSGDYFQLMWSVSDTAVQIIAQAAAAPVPAIPSIILTVTNNIASYVDHG
jgi:hypothetical protein